MLHSESFTIIGGSNFATPFFKCFVPGFAGGGGGAGTTAATSSSGMIAGGTGGMTSVFSTTAGIGGGGGVGGGSFLFWACAIPTMQTRQTGNNIFFINWF